jgi:hypothetical protein
MCGELDAVLGCCRISCFRVGKEREKVPCDWEHILNQTDTRSASDYTSYY